MKMIFAVVQDKDVAKLSERLVKTGVRATKLASTGGFLRAGNTTFMIGVEESRVDEVLTQIRQSCRTREEQTTHLTLPDNQIESFVSYQDESFAPYPVSVQVGGATVFVLPVDLFKQF
ncbi:MAG: cyclic-di-AMP receptor [Bacilli bacterium]